MTDEDKEDLKNAKNCFICGDKFRMNYKNAKEAEKYRKLETIVILQVSIEVVLIMFAILIFVIDILKFQYSFIT